jgi:hypothetical protein
MNCVDKKGRGTRWTVTLDRAAVHGALRPFEVPGQTITRTQDWRHTETPIMLDTVKILDTDCRLCKVLIEVPGSWPVYAFPAFQKYKHPLQERTPECVRFWVSWPPSELHRIPELLRDGGYTAITRFELAISTEPDEHDELAAGEVNP